MSVEPEELHTEDLRTEPILLCPQCRKPVPLDPPYWMWRGDWHCSQLCVTKRVPKQPTMEIWLENVRRGM